MGSVIRDRNRGACLSPDFFINILRNIIVDLTYLEMLLLVTVIAAAGINFHFGRSDGVALGMQGTLQYLVEEEIISRYVNKDGDVDFCSRGVMNNTCPKCGYFEGDNLGEQET